MFPFAGVALEGWWPPFMAAAVGVLFGLQATLLSAALYRLEDLFHRLPVHWMWWPALGAIIVGIGGVIDPRVLGAGYSSIQALLAGTIVTQALILLLGVKAGVWLAALRQPGKSTG